MPLLFLEKSEPNYFPFQVVKSDDGGGNLVAYDELNPTTGWTAPMASPFDGLWLRVEFSDYHVNFRHNGTTWVEYNKEEKIKLYGTTEFNTGLTDDDGNIIYGKTFNVVNTDLEATPGGTGYQTDIPKAYINEVIDYRIRLKIVTGDTVYALNHQDGGTSSSVYVGTSTFFDNWLVYPLTNSALVTYKITIYYTKK